MTALTPPPNDAPAWRWGAFAESIPGWVDFTADRDGPHRMPRLGPRCSPNPDHWAWWGWFITLLGPCEVGYDDTDPECGPWSVEIPGVFRMGTTIGRACIAAAAAHGRWPGGEG